MFAKSFSVLPAISVAKASCALVLAALVLAFAAETADARKGGRGWHGWHRGFYFQIERHTLRADRDGARADLYAAPADRYAARADRYAARGDRHHITALVPRSWRLQPPDPNWQGHRYVSPGEDAWLTFYGRSASEEPRNQYLKGVAFIEGEEVTYLRRERDGLVVSGFKGDKGERIFYRKVVLACGERQWRHLDLEYPAEESRSFDRLVASLSKALDRSVNGDCDANATVIGRN